jgi:hypothetical protein
VISLNRFSVTLICALAPSTIPWILRFDLLIMCVFLKIMVMLIYFFIAI